MRATEAPFEQPIAELRRRIEELESYPPGSGRSKELQKLRAQLEETTREVYSGLTRWEKTLVARHSARPYTLDYIYGITDEFIELYGDRVVKDDKAMVGGFGSINGQTIMFIGQQKGRTTKQRQMRNFGMANPEGFR